MAVFELKDNIYSEPQKSEYGLQGVSSAALDGIIANMGADDDTIEVRINCYGGDVAEGWAIHDKLRATGKKIRAVIEGQCASMATIVLLAASERVAYEHASLMIHFPYIPVMENARAEELAVAAQELRTQGERLVAYYVERTGADEAAIRDRMNQEKPMTMDEALKLGFISAVLPPASAKTDNPYLFNQNQRKMNRKERISKAWSELGRAFFGSVDMELTTATGATLEIDKEEGEPEVGDKARPDGTHKMADGKTIIVTNGEITEIQAAPEEAPEKEEAPVETPVGDADDEERIQMLEADVKNRDIEIESLKQEIERLKGVIGELKGDEEAEKVVAMMKNAGVTAAAVAKAISSNALKVPERAVESGKSNPADALHASIDAELEALRNEWK